MNEIQNPNQPSNSHELITDCNTDKMKTAYKMKRAYKPPEFKKPEPIENDGLLTDSYGNPVKHGTEIIIESNYNYPDWNGRKAYINWNPKQGMYNFQIEGYLSKIENFWGIHKFKVIQP